MTSLKSKMILLFGDVPICIFIAVFLYMNVILSHGNNQTRCSTNNDACRTLLLTKWVRHALFRNILSPVPHVPLVPPVLPLARRSLCTLQSFRASYCAHY